jgi:hypothetical protein
MSEIELNEPALWDRMAEILSVAANLCLHELPSARANPDRPSQADVEHSKFQELFGTDEPMQWIVELTGSYLFEMSHELLALSELLRARELTGSVEVLSRAVVERAGRTIWVLEEDDDVNPRVRAIRAALETAVSYQHYRRVVSDLGQTDSEMKELVEAVRAQRSKLESWFSVEKPVGSDSSEVSKWVVEDQEYPTYEKLARWVLDETTAPGRAALGTYGVLSSFSHPSYIAGREHRIIVDDKSITYSYSADYIDKVVRLALFGFTKALSHWMGYFDQGHEALLSGLQSIEHEWEALTPATGTASGSRP